MKTEYQTLLSIVTVNHCSKDNIMPSAMTHDAKKLKQLWIHDDAQETEESKEYDCSTAWYSCPHCNHMFSVFLGD